nr:cobyrinate a,c-diamide synthase [Croceicoccus hydrothermalis]
MVSAPASGQGKTLVTAALARLHRKAGRRVRVFKCGPDFLDPMILEQASGAPVYQLDLFMVGEDECHRLLHQAAMESDVILVEGVMGLFDGDPSAADLAVRFGLPVLAVVDGSAMAQTFGALAHGLASYRPDVNLTAVLANRVGSERHAEMLKASLPPTIEWLGALPRDAGFSVPERHLGLVQAGEIKDLDTRLENVVAHLPATACQLPAAVAFARSTEQGKPQRLLEGVCVAIARDEAFGFIYPANLECLKAMGARLSFFSPLRDEALPQCDALWLPGGYPELHLNALAGNRSMLESVRSHHSANKPILAECGGMLYCLDAMELHDGTRRSLAAILPGSAIMQPRLAALGLQRTVLDGETLRGHTFHYARMQTPLTPIATAGNTQGREGEPIFRSGSLTASFVHFYFPSSSHGTARLFDPLSARRM